MAAHIRKIRQDIDGVVFLDKPAGISSNDALIRAKRILNAKKAGHTGTLDPFATGLLPLCFGEATKFSHDLLEADKVYEATLHLGVLTTTGDTEGQILAQQDVCCTVSKLELVLEHFLGEIEQIPPMHSALKRDGRPLYEYARQGITLERAARQINIRQLQLLEYKSPFARVRVHCSKGTYIRVLAEDIGKQLGCGAHLKALMRTQIAHLNLREACSLEQLSENLHDCIHSIDRLLVCLPDLKLPKNCVQRFLHGQRLALRKEGLVVDLTEGRVRVYSAIDDQLLGTALIKAGGVLAPERLVMQSENLA